MCTSIKRYEQRSYNSDFQISIHKPVTSSDIILIKASLRHIQVSRVILLKNQKKNILIMTCIRNYVPFTEKKSNELSRFIFKTVNSHCLQFLDEYIKIPK